jgi:hypothetical protein
VTSTSIALPLMVPAKTRLAASTLSGRARACAASSTGRLSTGMDSPVTGAWLMLELPFSRNPSAGRRSLGRTSTTIAERAGRRPDLGGGLVADDDRRIGREFGQRFDGALGASHRVVLERMTQAEKEQQQRAFGPGAQRGGAGGGDQHQGVDFEALELAGCR